MFRQLYCPLHTPSWPCMGESCAFWIETDSQEDFDVGKCAVKHLAVEMARGKYDY
ncbi:hypothetical protein ES707_07545 [subsurface metagenome]